MQPWKFGNLHLNNVQKENKHPLFFLNQANMMTQTNRNTWVW